MAVKIQHKRGSRPPQPADLDVGEVALNTLEGKAYTKKDDGTVVEITGGESAGTGAGMVISPTEPVDPVDGMQWLDSTTARVWVWDENKWLEFPANVPAGEEYDDTELRGLISDEESARQLADEALQDQIDNLDIPEVGSGLIEVSEEPPEPPYEVGQQWFSSTDGYLYLWYGAEWVAVNMPTSSGGTDPVPDDPYWDNNFLLINCDGLPNESQEIVDVTGTTDLTVVGNIAVDATNAKYGTGAVKGTSGTSRIETPMYDISRPWTAEAWCKLERSKASSGIFSQWNLNGASWFVREKSLKLDCYFDVNGTQQIITSATNVFTVGEYLHVAVSWDGSVYRVFADGVLQGMWNQNQSLTKVDVLNLGIGSMQNSAQGTWQNNWEGWLDDIRITEGVARYTSDFTPPEKLPTATAQLRKPTIIKGEQDDLLMEGGNDADLS